MRRTPQKIIAALEAFGFGGTGMTPDLFLWPDQITRMGNPTAPDRNPDDHFRIGASPTLTQTRVVDVIDGVPVSLISADHLKIKQACVRQAEGSRRPR